MLKIGLVINSGRRQANASPAVVTWILAAGAAVPGTQYAWIDTSTWADANVWKD